MNRALFRTFCRSRGSALLFVLWVPQSAMRIGDQNERLTADKAALESQ